MYYFCRELIYLFTLFLQCKCKMNRREKQAFYFIITRYSTWHLVGIRNKSTCTMMPHSWGQQFGHLPTGNSFVVKLMCNLKYLSNRHSILEHEKLIWLTTFVRQTLPNIAKSDFYIIFYINIHFSILFWLYLITNYN